MSEEIIQHYKEQTNRIKSWCDGVGARLVTGIPLDDETIDIFPEMTTPYFGTVEFKVPPSYRAFLKVMGSLKIHINWGTRSEPDWNILPGVCNIYHPDEIIDRRGLVIIPNNVSGDDNRPLSTNHLIGFAVVHDASEETFWCFHTGEVNESGEMAILAHNLNELTAAVYVDDGHYAEPEFVRLEHISFVDWFDCYVKELCDITKERFDSMY